MLSQNLKKICYLNVRKQSHTLPPVTCCSPCLGAMLRAPTHCPCLLWRDVTVRFCVVLSVRVITVRYHMAAVGVRAAGRITGLLGDGGSEFKGEISDAGCDHPFSPLLPALVSTTFPA